ncbi:MAG: hypothetical protein IKF77_01565 [Thermoguttaceae bacterium]|nr:hypothetical protein [Thermoguttaceae bacterium]MBQ6619608.1 hypothetical protein [Thermoguttaceae bacterium]MBR2585187.1 hypothetical protein [Thermoguttaceae bacterium]MBR3218584.1 hypothetical protein [Thermoguttaceae bacterium]
MSKVFYNSALIVVTLLLLVVLAAAGCGGGADKDQTDTKANPAEEAAPADNAVLDTKSPTTPEGITDRFFSAFFSGRDQEAWGLLTEKAQNATKENFVAQASDTVGWEITKKSVEDGMAYVFVNVSDLTDTGDRATEELIFALRSDNGRWGVAGFSAGNLAVNFEETAVESYNAQNDLPAVEPERVSQMPSAEEIR